MSIKLKIEGFEDLMKEIEASGGSINKAADSAIRQSAQIMQSELKSQMQNAGVSSDLIRRMPAPEIEANANRYSAKVGYRFTDYNEKNLSDYHKAIFLNYGTPNRRKHGKERARGFIQVAKRKAKTKIKREQEKALKKILARLEK